MILTIFIQCLQALSVIPLLCFSLISSYHRGLWDWRDGSSMTSFLVFSMFLFSLSTFGYCLLNPRHLKCFIWLESFLRFPLKTAIKKFNKVWICESWVLWKRLWTWSSDFTTRIGFYNRFIIVIKKYFSPRCFSYQRSRRKPNDFHDWTHLVSFIFSCENRNTNKTFIHNASQTPHVNCCSVRDT